MSQMKGGVVMRAHMQRALRGLYHGARIGNGRHVTYADNRTKRKFMPNIVTKTLVSDVLDKDFTLRVSTRALRTIEKLGGLDNYLKKFSHEEIDSNVGSALKRSVQRAERRQAEHRQYQARVLAAAKAEL